MKRFALLLIAAVSTADAAPRPLDRIVAIGSASNHACAVDDMGRIACWGVNQFGQIGDGTTQVRGTARFLPGISTATQVTAGEYFSCAVIGGAAKCWGYNVVGQLGDGSTVDRHVPTPVGGLSSGVTSVGGGHAFACALVAGGVKCWGLNDFGQLGNGSTVNSAVPVNVAGLASGVTAIAVGYAHACALLAAGTLKCWGQDNRGQLGDGAFVDSRPTPVAVNAIPSGASSVAAGAFHTCAVVNGAARCWGNNEDAQLGDSSHVLRASPNPVIGLGSGVVQFALGRDFSCARLAAGAVRCWGNGQEGALGDDALVERATPVAVVNLGGSATFVAAGYAQAYALVGGRARGWGCANCLTLSNGYIDYVTAPEPVLGPTFTAQAIAAGAYDSCAIDTDGGVRCWGDNRRGQLGFSGTALRRVPTPVTGLVGIARLALGRSYACASGSGGSACWGANDQSQLGDGSSADRAVPAAIVGLSGNLLSIATGASHACAVNAAGAARCWGRNAEGQLGDGTTTLRSTPVGVTGLGSGVQRIAAGVDFSCALLAGGGVRCWGGNAFGQLGDGTNAPHATPAAVAGIGTAIALVAGDYHACALLAGGAMKCWGENDLGQLGDGTQLNRASPVGVFGLGSGVAAIAANFGKTCALTAVGPRCWGANEAIVPTAIPGLAAADALAPGFEHACVLQAGQVACRGGNSLGERGNGQSGVEPAPIDLLIDDDTIFADGFDG